MARTAAPAPTGNLPASTTPPGASAGGGAPSASPPPQRPRTTTGGGLPSGVTTVADNGAGIILALLAWGWIGLPLIQNGPTGVKNVLRAKFFNKNKDGSWLP